MATTIEKIREIEKQTGKKILKENQKIEEVTSLNLNSTHLSDYSFIADFIGLKSLHLGFNDITDFSFLKGLLGITELILLYNKPDDISFLKEFKELTSLNLHNNNLSDVSFIKELKNLRSLAIGDNKINDLSFIKEIKSLTSLNLSDIRSINDFSFISELQGLTTLDLSFTNPSDLSFLKQLKYMSKIDLASTKLQDYSFLSEMNDLKKLDLGYNNLKDVSYIKDLTKIIELGLGNNKFTDLSYIRNLIEIEFLNLSNNNLHDFTFIKDFQKLESLYLDDNIINDYSFLNELKELDNLSLEKNNIVDGSFLKSLTRLKYLYLDSNEIQQVSFLSELKSLTTLTLSNNKLKDDEISKIYDIYKDSDFDKLKLTGNPVVDIPVSALENWQSFKGYFESTARQTAGFKEKIVKIILLGNSNAGKSSLLEYFLNKLYDKNIKSTYGIEHQTSILKEKDAEMHFWDFGGQEYFHGTHHLFLSDKTVYLVLWVPEHEKGGKIPIAEEIEKDYVSNEDYGLQIFPYRYWLGIIKHFTGTEDKDSPVVLVQSKADLSDQVPVPEEYYKSDGRYRLKPGNSFYISVEGASKNEEEYLETWNHFEWRIKNIMANNIVSYQLPKEFRDIRLKIKDWSKERLSVTRDEFIKQCNEFVKTPLSGNEMEFLIRYLESCGLITQYPNLPQLKDIIFYDTASLAANIYKVLNSQVKKNGGRFILKDLEEQQIIDPKSLLSLMIYQDMVFEDPLKKGEYIAPQFMPEGISSKILAHLKQLLKPSFTLRFPDYMPRALLTRFITRYGGKSVENIYWKNGVLFKMDSIHALVEGDINGQWIRVFASGDSQRFVLLREIFIFFTFTGMKKIVDLMDHDKDSSKPEFYKSDRSENIYNYETIDHLELSADGENFATVSTIMEAISERLTKVKCLNNRYVPVEAIFHYLLTNNPIMPKKVFFSYSHADRIYRDEFEQHFAQLKRDGLVETWSDGMIQPGSDWDSEIIKNLKDADIILLMLSPEFMNSKYIWQKEIQIALQRLGAARIVPILLRPVDFSGPPLAGIQGIPRDIAGQIQWIAIEEHRPKRDKLYLEVINELRRII